MRLGRRAQLLAGTSVTYNAVEAVIAISAGLVAGSGALVAFGLDSIIEVSSGLIILWQFRHALPATRERLALRLIAISFFALATYVSIDAVRALAGSSDVDASPVGIALAGLSLLVMPWLSWAQRRTGRALASATVVADSTQTLLCTYLSAVLLAGLVLNATLGWAWADPIASLVIAAVALREGIQAWRGDNCCAPTPGPTATSTPDAQGTPSDSCCTTNPDSASTNTAVEGCHDRESISLRRALPLTENAAVATDAHPHHHTHPHDHAGDQAGAGARSGGCGGRCCR